MRKSYSIIATLALALSLNSVAAWAVEKAEGGPREETKSEERETSVDLDKADKILIRENISPDSSPPDCTGDF